METLGVLILLILVPHLYQKKKRKPALETRVNSHLYSITQCLTDEIFIYDAPPVYLSQELAPCRNFSQLEPQTLIMKAEEIRKLALTFHAELSII